MRIRGPLIVLIGLLGSSAAFGAKQVEATLGERHWTAVREYYNEQLRAGICPIGFAKKENGCAAPAQGRKWAVGKPLPPDAVRFEVPPALAARLGKPPAGHRYVRVGADILLVSNRTKLVADGVLDLGRR